MEDKKMDVTMKAVSPYLKYVSLQTRENLLTDLLRITNEKKCGCILLEGESGCGKSTLLRVLADVSHMADKDVVTIHIGEQLDSKVLVGTYTCTGVPGEFVWCPGILTQSVIEGKWVILEDIDQAPSDVMSLLLPLIKNNKLLIPGYTEPISAAKTFQLFVTRRLGSNGIRPVVQNTALLSVLESHMTKLSIPQYTKEDVTQILSTIQSSIDPLLPSIILMLKDSIDLRKLMKLSNRISHYIHNGRVTDVDDMMLEMIDVLAGDLNHDKRLSTAMELRTICGGLSREKVNYLCNSYKPVVQVAKTTVTIGRAFLKRNKEETINNCFVYTRSSLILLEKLGRCVQLGEPVLLVGETGVGKTAAVSYLANITGNTLITINLSQQTDSTDLLGGFKPVLMSQMILPLRLVFDDLFTKTFDVKKSSRFLTNVQMVVVEKNWKKLLDVFIHSVNIAKRKLKDSRNHDLITEWVEFENKASKMKSQLEKPEGKLLFTFVEGALVESVRKGFWVLLDEVNLASPEALQCLNSLLEGPHGSFILTENVDHQPVKRHPDFRLFCCMNPATDIGKKSLTPNLRNRFSEFYVNELRDPSDLRTLISGYLCGCNVTPPIIDGIIKFYNSVRELANNKLQDGTGRRPHYSLRTLCRSLKYAASNPCKNLLRSLHEGFLMSFLTQLKLNHHVVISTLSKQCLNIPDLIISSPLPKPHELNTIQVEGFWLAVGTEPPVVPVGYILTNSVCRNLKNLARVVSGGRHPVLLQGPTSAGKTSLVQYLARVTGHKCLRVNNHEHTDLQEYIGLYTSGTNGELVFQEGALVEAMRKGYWIILDELNLAPTDVLEALNRVLDDNRELFIPETQELVQAHPHFMLFGTQNPAGVYGGRKVLSRAFRNRFVELHYDDILSKELVQILNLCCALPETYAKKMVSVMKHLQQRRSISGVFEGKHSLITLRDLFRWAERYRKSSSKETFYDWEQQLAEDGFMLLSGRLRNKYEESVICHVIEKHFKCCINPSNLFGWDEGKGGLATIDSLNILGKPLPIGFEHIVWTPELLRMGILVHRAVKFQEPVLLVGNTGCGKTTLCQLIMNLLNKKVFSINCHMHTEAADFLGGLRPIRNRSENEDRDMWTLFEWCDGLLVEGMKEGGCVLIDEISLAEDAVLERLNSVLEPERKLLVVERGRHKDQIYEVIAKEGFLLLATMNPGGDYGKKELSPALRNRFVEIWCPDINTNTGYSMIINHNLKPQLKDVFCWSELMLLFIDWLKKMVTSNRFAVTTRDILKWVEFMNILTPALSPANGFYHGAQMIFIDALGCSDIIENDRDLQQKCEDFLRVLTDNSDVGLDRGSEIEIMEDRFGIYPFFIETGVLLNGTIAQYCLNAKGPFRNVFRLLRAMQLERPIMLEGDPGVGKTSLVTALAAAGGHTLTRINLSEHTDISDLFGSDLPVEGEESQSLRFAWRDGPFLKALKNSEWILLDEMNLASQSVLEGLNACLDHRGEIFIPELNQSFIVPVGTRLFACQNPHNKGGGRKGLPKSFINRFIQVYMEPMSCDDLIFITHSLYPEIKHGIIKQMVTFNNQVRDLVCHHSNQFEFNLRDILRWCELMKEGGGVLKSRSTYNPGEWINMLYVCRLPDMRLRRKVLDLFFDIFKDKESYCTTSPPGKHFHISENYLLIGQSYVRRGLYRHGDDQCCHGSMLLPCQIPLLEVMLQSVSMNWMTILVGGSCSGKSYLVHTLAHLTGNKLMEFPLNTNTDTMELIGGFEQVNLQRDYINLVNKILDIVKCLMTEDLRDGMEVKTVRDVMDNLQQFITLKVVCLEEKDKDQMTKRLGEVHQMIEQLTVVAKQQKSKLISDLDLLQYEVTQLLIKVGVVSNSTVSQFEWVDSLLVKSVREGHWILLSHANFCSPSVLDRLNPLLEPKGVLTIDERGVVEGNVTAVVPHPNFRLFLTMDSAHGEISRAMRNRGIEIFVLPEDKTDLYECLSNVNLNSFPLVHDITLQPTTTLVNNELKPILDFLNKYHHCDALDIKEILKIDSVIRVFIYRASTMDYQIRSGTLNDLANLMDNCHYLRGLLLTGHAVMSDVMFIKLTNQIKELLETELGITYEGYINYDINERINEIINRSDVGDLINKKLESFRVHSHVKWLSGLCEQLSKNQSNWSGQPALFQISMGTETNIDKFLSHGTVTRLRIFINNFLSSLIEPECHLLEDLKEQREIFFKVLTIFIHLCYIPRCKLSLIATVWCWIKKNCIKTFIPAFNDLRRASLLNQLESLSEMDFLVSKDIMIVDELSKLLGGPNPPSSLDEIQERAHLEQSDRHLTKSSSPPLHLLSDSVATLRKNLLLEPDIAHNNLLKHHQEIETLIHTPMLSCVILPALNELGSMFLSLQHDINIDKRIICSVLEYCVRIPDWLITSLKSLTKIDRTVELNATNPFFLPLMELIHVDPQLQLINSSHTNYQGHTSPTDSVTSLCFNFLLGDNATMKGNTPITLGNYPVKISQMNTLYQFLWFQGFSPIHHQQAILHQGVKIVKEIIMTVSKLLLNIINERCATSDTREGESSVLSDTCEGFKSQLNNLNAQGLKGITWSLIHSQLSIVLDLIMMENMDLKELSQIKIHLGVALSHLFSPTFPLDPLEMKRAKVDFYDLQENQNYYLMESHESHMTHHSCHSWDMLFPNPTMSIFHIGVLCKELEVLKSEKMKYQQHCTHDRLQPDNYSELVISSSNIIQTLCHYEKINSLIKDNSNNINVWLDSMTSAINQLRQRFPTYNDLIQPFTASLTLLSNGVRTLSEQLMIFDNKNPLKSCISCLVWFPYWYEDGLRFGEVSRLNDIILCCQNFTSKNEKFNLNKRLTMVAVDTATSLLIQSPRPISPTLINIINQLLKHCYHIWKMADIVIQEKQREEEDIYKYKSRVIEIRGEEEEYVNELNEVFPSYEKDFISDEEINDDLSELLPCLPVSCDQFTNEEMAKIRQLHNNLFVTPTSHMTTDSAHLIRMYEIAGELIKEVGGACNSESRDIGGHIRACHEIITMMKNDIADNRCFNIYKHPFIHEAIKVEPILQELVERVNQVLQEWPDYPVLMQILSSCNMVLSLNVSEPLMKILTGLELVLRKSQDWESYSSSRLSLSKPLSSLSQLIMKWRRMELSCWKNLFDICQREIECSTSHWWFILYGLCSEQVKGGAEEGRVKDFVMSLQQLIETSCIGEFMIRLEMIMSFSKQFDKGSSSFVSDILTNVYNYYKQFMKSVGTSLHELTKPVHKELNEYLSIMKWNDRNYWTIKLASEKSHRTLLRFMKKYKDILNQPVQPVLTTGSVIDNWEKEETDHMTSRLNHLIMKISIQSTEHVMVPVNHTPSLIISLSEGVSLTSVHCIDRMSVLLKRYMSRGVSLDWCLKMDEFIGCVINTYQDLQRNDIPSGVSKEKRLSVIKLLLMRRRKALADLFKTMKEYGLSHRKGEELSDDLHVFPFSLPSIPVSPLSEDYDIYYYRSVARMVALTSFVANPSKDLSLYHVICVRGYSRHVMKMLCEQRVMIRKGLENIESLDNLIKRLILVIKEDCSRVNIRQYYNWQSNLICMVESCICAITDTEKLLSMVPSLDLSLTPVSPLSLPPLLRGEEITDVLECVDEWKNKMLNLLKKLSDNVNYCLVSKSELIYLQDGFQLVEQFVSVFIPECLQKTLGDESKCSGLMEYLVALQDKMMKNCVEFSHWVNDIHECAPSTNQVSSVTCSVEELVVSVMMGVQKVMEREKEMITGGRGTEEGFPLIKNLYDYTINNLQELHCDTVINQLSTLLRKIVTTHSEYIPIPILTETLPLLKEYRFLLHRVNQELQLCHRTTAKMASIVFDIFTNLSAKGFCTPDLSEEEDGGIEGEEFVDMDAGGFDEGEGSKNVNDKVDQSNLDPGGGEGEGEKRDEDNDALEMNEDFEGRTEDIPHKEDDIDKNENESDEEEDLDKKMGQLEDDEERDEDETLDRQMWAPEEEEEEEDTEMNKNSGGGTSMNQETQIVAKEDSKPGKTGEENEDPSQNGKDPPDIDDEEIVNDIDEYFEAGKEPKQNNDEEGTDFGDLNLDKDDKDDNEEMEKSNEEEIISDMETDEVTSDQPQTNQEEIEEDEGQGEDEGQEEDERGREDEGQGEGQVQEMEDEVDEEMDTNGRSYSSSDTIYGVPQSQSTDTKDQKESNTQIQERKETTADEQSSEDPNSDTGTVTTATDQDKGSTVIPVSLNGNTKETKPSRRKHSQHDNMPYSLSDPVNRPVKRAKLMKSSEDNLQLLDDYNSERQTKDSDQYQHVTENQDSDNVAWDTVNGTEGGGKYPLGEEPTDDLEEDNGGLISEEVSMATEYQISNEDKEGSVNHTDQEEEEENNMDINRPDKREDTERVRPTNSFFATGDSSIWNNYNTIDEMKLRESLQTAVETLHKSSVSHDSTELWMQYEALTSSLSHSLCEELRLILQPTQAAKLKGDFRTGKRLNMRRIIPYIASNFQNDRIWLRRSRPSKREYQILLAMDDSASMKENDCNQMAYESLALISASLQKLECGQLGICRFGETVEVLHSLDQPFSATQGGHILQHLDFSQTKTNFVKLLQSAESLFSQCLLQGRKTSLDISQLLVILSDGRGVFADGTQAVESGVRKLTEMGVFSVFIILDGLAKDSVVDIKVPTFVPGQPPIIKSYLDTFPFPFYIVLRDIQSLPSVLGESLRQWFELVTMET